MSGWRRLVAELVIELGWTHQDVLEMDLDFLDDLNRVWKAWPPLRMTVAAALGHKPPTESSNDYAELLAMFPGGVIKG